MQLVLASTSPYRRQLLERLRLPFETARPEVDETARPGEAPDALATRLAAAKARAIAAHRDDACVIGSDQVAGLDGVPLGKPGNAANACAQLAAMSGRSVRFLTALHLMAPGWERSMLDVTEVRFRSLSSDEISRYVQAESPLDCAGSFKCEGLGISLFEAIRADDPTALVGLPLIALAGLLREAGYLLP
ncbi:MAG: Maf family nucleotide pyrophosphatase [Pseudomonas sp.]